MADQHEIQPLYVPVKRVQQVFGIHRSTIYRLADRGRLTIYKFADSVPLVKVSEMEALMERRGADAVEEAG